MNIRTSVDTSRTLASLGQYASQLPFATSLALNTLANQFQRVQQEHVLRRFTVRQTRFILNTIKRVPGQDFATKRNLQASVRVDESRDFLAKFEDGGTKHPIQGRQYLAVPSPEIRRTKRGLIPRRFYPSAFKPWQDQPSGLTTGQQRTFIVPLKDGRRLMLQRTGKRTVKALYLFVPSVRIDDRLDFADNAIEVARTAWPSAFAQAWTRAIRTAR